MYKLCDNIVEKTPVIDQSCVSSVPADSGVCVLMLLSESPDIGAMHSVMVSTSAFLACHKC